MPAAKTDPSTSPESGLDQGSTEQRLFREAARLFRKQGFDRTSTRELAAAIGLQSASLYHYMRTKEDLLAAICSRSNELMYAAVSEAAKSAASPLDALQAAMRAQLETAIENRDVYMVALSEHKALSPPARREIDRQRDAYSDLLVDILKGAQRSGDLRTDISADHLVLVLRNLMAWTVFWFRTDGALTLEEVRTLMQRIFLEGANTP